MRTTTQLSRRIRRVAGSETAFAATGNAVLIVAGLFTGIISARVLEPQGRGEFLAICAWAAITGLILSGSVSHSLVTYIGRGLPLSQIQRFVWRHLALTLALGAALVTLVFMSGSVSWLTFSHAVGAVLLTVSTVAVANLIGIVLGYNDIRVGLQRVRLVPIMGGLGAMLLLTASGNRSPGTWLLATSAAQLAPSMLYLIRLVPNPSRTTPGIEHVKASAIIRTAGRFYPAGVAAQINYRLDLLIVSLLLPPAAVAHYGVAVGAGTAVASIGQAVGLVYFRRFAAPEARRSAVPAVRRAVIMAASFSAAIAIPVALGSPILVPLLYGERYAEAVLPTVVLVLGAIPLSVEYLLIHAFLGLQQLFRRLYAILALTAALTTTGVLAITATTANLTWVASVSPVVYSISVFLLLRSSRGFVASED